MCSDQLLLLHVAPAINRINYMSCLPLTPVPFVSDTFGLRQVASVDTTSAAYVTDCYANEWPTIALSRGEVARRSRCDSELALGYSSNRHICQLEAITNDARNKLTD
jgi:hypothetical protein